MNEFDNIKPYSDKDVSAAIKRLADNELFPAIIHYLFPDRNFEEYRNEFINIKTVKEFQVKFVYSAMKSIIKNTSTGFHYSGANNIDKDDCHVYISNHRDIALDAALFDCVLYENNIDTCEITFGNNLMQGDFIIDFGKINKMFRIMRGGNAHDFYKQSIEVSQYIRYTILEKKQSIWIAQRNGRTKDGDDKTELGVLKMLSLGSKSNFVENFNEINILPISISYEYEPCDFMKTQELFITKYQKYEKEPGEDMKSILNGISQKKGEIHLSICPPIIIEELEYCDRFDKNEKFIQLAKIIDDRIYRDYKLFKNNYIAHDLLNKSYRYENHYSKEDKESFIQYKNNGLSQLNGDYDELEQIFLKIYATPVDNCERFKKH